MGDVTYDIKYLPWSGMRCTLWILLIYQAPATVVLYLQSIMYTQINSGKWELSQWTAIISLPVR